MKKHFRRNYKDHSFPKQILNMSHLCCTKVSRACLLLPNTGLCSSLSCSPILLKWCQRVSTERDQRSYSHTTLANARKGQDQKHGTKTHIPSGIFPPASCTTARTANVKPVIGLVVSSTTCFLNTSIGNWLTSTYDLESALPGGNNILAKSNSKEFKSKVSYFSFLSNQCLTLWLRKPCLSIRSSPRALKLFQIITKHTWELGLSFVDHVSGEVTLTIVLGNNLSQIFSFNWASRVLMGLEEYESNHLRNKLIRFLISKILPFKPTISDIYRKQNRKKV